MTLDFIRRILTIFVRFLVNIAFVISVGEYIKEELRTLLSRLQREHNKISLLQISLT